MKHLIHLYLACLALLGSAVAQTITSSQDIRLRFNPLIANSPLIHGLFSSAAGSVPDPSLGDGLCRLRTDPEKYVVRNEGHRNHRASLRTVDFVLRHRVAIPIAEARAASQDDCPRDKHGCYTCVEHWDDDDDKCVDNPGVTHHGPNYDPGSSESCWVITRCLCEQGQYPRGESCSPCRYSGQETVCISH